MDDPAKRSSAATPAIRQATENHPHRLNRGKISIGLFGKAQLLGHVILKHVAGERIEVPQKEKGGGRKQNRQAPAGPKLLPGPAKMVARPGGLSRLADQ